MREHDSLFERLLDTGFGYLGKDHFLGELLVTSKMSVSMSHPLPYSSLPHPYSPDRPIHPVRFWVPLQ
jgi:hypothetical protein